MRTSKPGSATQYGFWLALLLLASSRWVSADEEGGWDWIPFVGSPSLSDEVPELPAYPQSDRLLELSISNPGYDFRAFVDPRSLVAGAGSVVRYTLVIVSSSGSKNISYEGLHCGSHQYRRYAYGTNGRWVPIEGSSWKRMRDTGLDHYRYVLYRDYLCSSLGTDLDVDEMINRIRNPSGFAIHE
jgi:hypothetical protein